MSGPLPEGRGYLWKSPREVGGIYQPPLQIPPHRAKIPPSFTNPPKRPPEVLYARNITAPRLPRTGKELELELIQFHMAQKPVLRGEVDRESVARDPGLFFQESKVKLRFPIRPSSSGVESGPSCAWGAKRRVSGASWGTCGDLGPQLGWVIERVGKRNLTLLSKGTPGSAPAGISPSDTTRELQNSQKMGLGGGQMTQMRASEHRKARGGRCGAPGLRLQHWSYAAPLRRFLAPLLVTAGAWCASASNAARSAKVNGTQSTSASDTEWSLYGMPVAS